MHPNRLRRLHVRRALLNKKHSALAKSFLRPLIQFAGIAKLHSYRLSDVLHDVICLLGILVACCLRGLGVAAPSQTGDCQMTQMSPLRRRMIEDMTVRNLSPATQRSYISAVSKLSRYFGQSPDKLDLEDVRAFQVHLISTGSSATIEVPVSSRNHPARVLALSPVHPELSRRRRLVGGTWHHGLLRA